MENIIEIKLCDITKLQVDAIVNAANNSLLGGGGVDGAIHRAAGKELLEECRALNGCKTGEAKITNGYKLPAKYVIHTVGPVWRGGNYNEAEQLASCYRSCLLLSTEFNIKSIAFPAISTGVYHYPLEQATRIALTEVLKYLKNNKLEKIIFSCFNADAEYYYRNILEELYRKIKEFTFS